MAFVNFFLPKLNWILFSQVEKVKTLGLIQQLKSLGKEPDDSALGVGEREGTGTLLTPWTWLPWEQPEFALETQ